MNNDKLYSMIDNIIENVMNNEPDDDKAKAKIIETLHNVFDSKTQEIRLYIINYDDDSGDYDIVADNVFKMINNAQVLNFTTVRYSDFDMGIVAAIVKRVE